MMPPKELRSLAEATAVTLEATVEGSACAACGRLHVPARRFRCLACGGRSFTRRDAALEGTIESFTESVAKDGTRSGLVLVRLDAGPMLTAQLVPGGARPEVGARVVGTAERGAGAPRFRFALAPQTSPEEAQA